MEENKEKILKKLTVKTTIYQILIIIEVIFLIGLISNIVTVEYSCSGESFSEYEIASYNQAFQAYEGTKSGTQVRALLDKVRTHNLNNQDDLSRNIRVQNSDVTKISTAPTKLITAEEIDIIRATIKAGKTYTVTLGYDANSSLVVAIGIAEK